ncbi:MAG: glycosyltransferase family 4 protein, partial [Clostridiaceae bacterium]|nr:glycosyltransferase family 4 protein [Clostridiaceae bacterium]
MRILHCCLSCFYIDNFGYQENILPRINHEDGHDMLIIASTETYKNGSLCYSNPSEYRTEYGVKIIRLPYARWLPSKIGKKLRIMSGFKKALYGFNPDVILFHGSCGYEIVTVAEYRAAHPDTKLYVDSHEAFYNSAKNWVSKNILHGVFYRTWFRKALPKIDKVLYIGLHEKYYMRDFMHTPEVKLAYFPLGGEIISEKEKKTIRSEIRANHGINENTMVFIHTGKLNPLKKTIELMHAFSTYKDGNALLLIIGVVSPKMEDEFNARLIEDRRIRFLG